MKEDGYLVQSQETDIYKKGVIKIGTKVYN